MVMIGGLLPPAVLSLVRSRCVQKIEWCLMRPRPVALVFLETGANLGTHIDDDGTDEMSERWRRTESTGWSSLVRPRWCRPLGSISRCRSPSSHAVHFILLQQRTGHSRGPVCPRTPLSSRAQPSLPLIRTKLISRRYRRLCLRYRYFLLKVSNPPFLDCD